MLNKLGIGTRLILVLSILIFGMLVVSLVAINSFKKAENNQIILNNLVDQGVKLRQVTEIAGQKLRYTLFSLNHGALTWSDAKEKLKHIRIELDTAVHNYLNSLSPEKRKEKQNPIYDALEPVHRIIEEGLRIIRDEDYVSLALFIENDVSPDLEPLLQWLEKESQALSAYSQNILNKAQLDIQNATYTLYAVILIGLFLGIVIGWLLYRSITRPLFKISQTIDEIAQGRDEARTQLNGVDEISQLGQAFDAMLDEKTEYLKQKEKENEALNDAVLNLLQAVYALSQKDLTVKVPVSEDATGPVADAINLMAEETAKVLWEVQQIAKQVNESAVTVNDHALNIQKSSEEQTRSISDAMTILNAAANKLAEIAKVAEQVSSRANQTSDVSGQALETVNDSLQSMDQVRESVQEAGKYIKRLGDRSQEIGTIIDVINNIAERTTILALNASMQAASAGEAGRGFAVVADEIQRLATSARQSTEQIANLVKNIQTETSGTIATMDKVIAQVVDSSEKAQKAGEQMGTTQNQIESLVHSMENIAQVSVDQAQVAHDLSDKVANVKDKIMLTHTAIVTQIDHTQKLTEYASHLVQSVSVFKLPQQEQS